MWACPRSILGFSIVLWFEVEFPEYLTDFDWGFDALSHVVFPCPSYLLFIYRVRGSLRWRLFRLGFHLGFAGFSIGLPIEKAFSILGFASLGFCNSLWALRCCDCIPNRKDYDQFTYIACGKG